MGISSFTTGFTKSSASSYGAASGGTSSSITINGRATTLLTFTASGTLTVTKDGIFDILLQGGGAAGCPASTRTNQSGGGGGAGGLLRPHPTYLTSGTYTVTVGGASSGAGNPSGLGNILVGGGGFFFGGEDASVTMKEPANGSPCGGGGNGSYNTGGTGITGLGFAGGNRNAGGDGDQSAGGGGTAALGVNKSAGGAGGAGTDISAFLGQSAGTTFKGGGGGGAGRPQYTQGGQGGSGIVYVRFTP